VTYAAHHIRHAVLGSEKLRDVQVSILRTTSSSDMTTRLRMRLAASRAARGAFVVSQGKLPPPRLKNNTWYGMKDYACAATEECVNPQFVNQPTFTKESDLDNFNTALAPSSPSVGQGCEHYRRPTNRHANLRVVRATSRDSSSLRPFGHAWHLRRWGRRWPKEHEGVNVPAGTTVRFGFGTHCSASVSFTADTTFIATNAASGANPSPNQFKGADALGDGGSASRRAHCRLLTSAPVHYLHQADRPETCGKW